MKYLADHVGSLVAAALAVFFVVGTGYSIVFLESVAPGLRAHVTFVDIVNTSVHTSPGPLLTGLFAFVAYVAIESEPDPRIKWISLVLSLLIFCYIVGSTMSNLGAIFGILPVLYLSGMFISMTCFLIVYTVEWRLKPILIFVVIISSIFSTLAVFKTLPYVGLIMSYGVFITVALFLTLRGKETYEVISFIPVLLAIPVILAMVSVAAVLEAHLVKECKRPHTALYTRGISQKPTSSQLCLVLSLERGMLFYDKGASETKFIPWSQLSELTGQQRFLSE